MVSGEMKHCAKAGRLSAVRMAMECHDDASPRTPFAAPRRSPQGETRILAALCFERLMRPKAERRVKFPLRGKGGALAPKGVHFQRPQGGCMVFPRAESGCYGFYSAKRHIKLIAAKGGDTTPSEPARCRRAKPFEPSEPGAAEPPLHGIIKKR
jgi:hypothetical protein